MEADVIEGDAPVQAHQGEALPAVRAESAVVAQPKPEGTPSLLHMAVQRGATVEELDRLMTLQERMLARDALTAFNNAFARFKAEAISIPRTKEITDGPLKGKKHVELGVAIRIVTPYLSQHGLSLSWALTKDEPNWLEVTCTLRHAAGHSENVSMGGEPDTGPGRNKIQARCSTKTYLERYTATAILGLAPEDEDDDGAGGAREKTGGTLAEQGREVAIGGTAAFNAWWNGLSAKQRNELGKEGLALRRMAREADQGGETGTPT